MLIDEPAVTARICRDYSGYDGVLLNRLRAAVKIIKLRMTVFAKALTRRVMSVSDALIYTVYH